MDSVTQGSFNVYYQLSISPVTTGIKWASDSLQLLDTTKGKKVMATLSNSYYKYSFSGLVASNKYYFKIFATDKDGKTTYSSIYSQAMRTYSILVSPFIVAGPTTLNYRTSPLIIAAYINDTTHANYSIKLNGIPTTISQFTNCPGFAITDIFIDVPPTLELGNTQLEVAYKGKIVYTSTVTIVNGGLLTVTHHPGIFAGGTFFNLQ